MSAAELPRAYGEAVLSACIRQQPEDFQVEEVLGFEPDGDGEHLWLWIEKRSANTAWVAGQLARWAGVNDRAIGYAGLKDRHALTRQAFTVHLPGRDAAEPFPLHPEFRLLSQQRHRRKLQRGALKGNRFQILLREVVGDRAAIEARLQAISRGGVPNYFGEQRFGRDGDNVAQARAMFAGRRVRREQAGMLLSAVRSAGFNQVLAARVRDGNWNCLVAGEVPMLNGSQSVFGPEPLDALLQTRCADGDLHPTGVLWGQGDLRSQSTAAEYDGAHGLDEELQQGLRKAGLRQERRALRLPVTALHWQWPTAEQLALAFELPAGAYATSVLHELGLTSTPNRASE